MNQRTAHITGRPRMSAIALVVITNKKKSLGGKESGPVESSLDTNVYTHQPIADSARANAAMEVNMKPGQGYMKPAHTTMLAAPSLVQPVHFGQMRRNQAGTLWPARN